MWVDTCAIGAHLPVLLELGVPVVLVLGVSVTLGLAPIESDGEGEEDTEVELVTLDVGELALVPLKEVTQRRSAMRSCLCCGIFVVCSLKQSADGVGREDSISGKIRGAREKKCVGASPLYWRLRALPAACFSKK